MSRVVFFVEEPSMKGFLDSFLERHFPKLEYLCVTHEGKNDLQASIKRKVPAWRTPGDHIVILHDNDGQDCIALKAMLLEFCGHNVSVPLKVRIVCQELEAWYFGQPDVLESLYSGRMKKSTPQKARRSPDDFVKPSAWLRREVDRFQKVSGAREMGRVMHQGGASPSFKAFVDLLTQTSEKMS